MKLNKSKTAEVTSRLYSSGAKDGHQEKREKAERIQETVYFYGEEAKKISSVLDLFSKKSRGTKNYKSGITKAKIVQALTSRMLEDKSKEELKDIVVSFLL